MKAIILCGGIGKRLWPKGRQKQPKQFHSLLNDVSLLQQTYKRLRVSFKSADIFISTSSAYVTTIKKELPQIAESNYIIEPARKDTAAAMGYAAFVLSQKFAYEPCVFVPSDHYVDNARAFCKTLRVGEHLIKTEGVMVDIGVPPTWPNTALGYTRIGKRLAAHNGVRIFEFKGHTEKPNKSVASRYVNGGQYLWHVNYYMWTPARFLEALERYAPTIRKKLETSAGYKTIQPISFDYAVTEKMNPRDVRILEAPFAWSDVGSWDEVWSEHPHKDIQKNVFIGDVAAVGSKRNLVMGGKRLIALAGVEDLVIIDTDDALLVCPKDRSQDVKKLVDLLSEKKRGELL